MTRIPARLFALALLLGLSPAGFTQALNTSSIDSIVAVVEEDVILRSELDQAVRNVTLRFADRADQLPPANILERQVLERLIVMRLQLQRADAMGLRVGDIELDQTLAHIAQQQGATVDQMRAQLTRDGMNFQDFRQQVRDEIIVSRLQQNFVQNRVTVSESEIDNALANRGEEQSQVHLGYLLVATPDGATPEEIETARSKIEGIRNLIAAGEMDFTAAAMRYSDHQTALEGGDMGWRGMDEIPPLFANILPDMNRGDVSQPMRGPSGYSLIQLIDKRDQSVETLTEYRARSLMVRITELVSREQAREKIMALQARINAGEEFAAVARESSDDQITRAQGGDMGWFPINAWGQAVANALTSLSDGQVSEPFQSEVGWHLIQRLETREQDITREAQRTRMRELIVRRKADDEFERFLRQLRSESYIDERIGGSS